MLVKRVSDIEPWVDPDDSRWAGLAEEVVPMMQTPVALQPTQYIRVKWESLPYGQTASISTRAVHDGKRIAFFCEWQCAVEHKKDAVAIALPIRGQPILMTMGSADSPIHFLHWLAGKPGVRSTHSQGIGSTQQGVAVVADGKGTWNDGVRRVVITRQLGGFIEGAPLLAGKSSKIGYAVWQGANDERAGLKSFSIDWKPLDIEV
ncbi:MAG: hypothetical protein V7754_04525 [Halioglobus sp.]